MHCCSAVHSKSRAAGRVLAVQVDLPRRGLQVPHRHTRRPDRHCNRSPSLPTYTSTPMASFPYATSTMSSISSSLSSTSASSSARSSASPSVVTSTMATRLSTMLPLMPLAFYNTSEEGPVMGLDHSKAVGLDHSKAPELSNPRYLPKSV